MSEIDTDRLTREQATAYRRMIRWFVLAMLALGLYFWLAMLDVTLFALWPLLAVVCVGIFECGTVKP